MKKYFMCAMAAVAMLSVSSCSSEEEVNMSGAEGVGYISLNTSTEDAVITRAAADITTFKAKVYTGGLDGTYVWGTKDTYADIDASINTTPMSPANYVVDVRNYNNMGAALAANSNYGAAYWEGQANVTVVTATKTPVTVACGQPKNTKLILNAPAFGGTALSLNVTDPRTLAFVWNNSTKVFDHAESFFAPAAQLSYTISYTINGISKVTDAKTLTMGAAGTAKKLTIASNTNGTIILSITTEDFGEAVEETLTFDAATGEEVKK